MHAARHVVMFLSDDFGRQGAGSRGERIDRRENAQFGDRAFQHDRRVQVREGCGRRRVGQIVRGHIDGLKRRDGAFLGRSDSFLQIAHFRGERRLITDGAGGAAQQRRNFGAGLGEAEDVIDEQQHVLVLFVAEILGDGQAGEGDAQARARRFVHLPIDQGDFRFAPAFPGLMTPASDISL